MEIKCSITARVYYLNQILSKASKRLEDDYLYFQVSDGKLEIFQPLESLITYFTITEKHLTSIDVYQDEPALMVVDPDKLHDVINWITPKKVTIQAKKHPQEIVASEITVSDPQFERCVNMDIDQSIDWAKLSKKFAKDHGIDPHKMSTVDSREEAAEKIFDELIKLEDRSELDRFPLESGIQFISQNNKYPITNIRRKSPNFIYSRLPSEFQYPTNKINRIKESFNSRGEWVPPRNWSAEPVYIETSVETMETIIEAAQAVYDAHKYSITVEDQRFIIDISSEHSVSGSLPAGNVEGSDCNNMYGVHFANAGNNLSGDIELHTAPQSPLAIIERNRGYIYRYIIPLSH